MSYRCFGLSQAETQQGAAALSAFGLRQAERSKDQKYPIYRFRICAVGSSDPTAWTSGRFRKSDTS